MRVETRPFQQDVLGTRALDEQRIPRPAASGTPHPIPGDQSQAEQIPDRMVRAAADAANKVASMFGTTVEFAVHEETGFEILRVIDTRTNTVLREMPPHEVLDMIARMWDAIGVFVDKTA